MQFLAYTSEQALQYSGIAAHLSGAGNDKEGGGLAMTRKSDVCSDKKLDSFIKYA